MPPGRAMVLHHRTTLVLNDTAEHDREAGAWADNHFARGEPMLILVLGLTLLAVLVVMVVSRRYVGRLTSLATLIASAMVLLWLIDSGMLPGTEGPLTSLRPRTLLDGR